MSESTWDDPRITAYVLGELPEGERADFESEMESRPDLAAAVEEARSLTGQLESLYAGEPIAPLEQQRRESIVDTAEDRGATVSPSGIAGQDITGQDITGQDIAGQDIDAWSWKTPLILLATAASLVLLVGVAPWLTEPNVTVSELNATAEPRLQPMDEVAESKPAPESAILATDAPAAVELSLSPNAPEENTADAIAPNAQDKSTIRYEAAIAGVATTETKESLVENVADREASDFDASNRVSQRENDKTRELAAAGMRGGIVRRSASTPKAAAKSNSERLDRNGDGVAGVVEIESVPEQGTVVMRGKQRDLERVEKRIADFQRLGEKKDSSINATKPDATSLAAAESHRYHITPGELPALEGEQKLAQSASAGLSKDLAANGYRVPGQTATPAPTSGPTTTGDAPFAPQFASGAATAPKASAAAIATQGIASSNALGRKYAGRAMGLPNAPNEQVKSESLHPRPGLGFGAAIDQGRGPGARGDQFDPITDNPFKRVTEHPLSTFSVDVDTASYSKTRDFLLRQGHLPRPDAVRIEEMLNYFDYGYEPPSEDAAHPFATRTVITSCPWNKEHRLARIALKGKTMDRSQRPRCNLVFLLDTSGSMKAPNKLPLVIDGMQMLLKQLNEKDRVAITVYAGSAGMVLDSTLAKKRKKIRKALTQLSAGGSTNGGAGIALAYQTARDNFISDGVNRVILCTDGDFNVGTTGTDELVRMVENEAKGGVFLSVLGFGMGNHNDAMLEKISGRGNGNYAFIDTEKEARKVLVDQTSGTLVTIAKDVKLQVEFNPAQVSSYRLIGYENRLLAKEDFNDDSKDAGEIGAGHAVTALYEIVPAGVEADASAPKVDDLKYQSEAKLTSAADRDEMLTLKLRYKQPDAGDSTYVDFPVSDEGGEFKDASQDVRFAAAVAGFGMQLRRSEYAGNWTLTEVLDVAKQSKGEDKFELRAEFVEMVRKAKELMGQQ